MELPRYYFGNDYKQFEGYFLSKNPFYRHFTKGSILWTSGETLRTVYYIRSGLMLTSVEHEDGYKKNLSFHGSGTVFPGCHETVFKIEQSLICKALSDMEVLVFSRDEFYRMYQQNMELRSQVLEWYAMYINLLIYGYAHQDYNDAFTQLCNFLYIYIHHAPESENNMIIPLSQEMLGDFLGINRVHISNLMRRLKKEEILITKRNRLEIIGYDKLLEYCSSESLKI